MVKDIKINAATLDPWLSKVEIKHPLIDKQTSTQVTSLRSTLSAVTIPSTDTQLSPPNPPTTSTNQDDVDVFSSLNDGIPVPSNAAVLASLFGWSLVPTLSPDPTQRPSLTRSNSLTPSSPRSPSTLRSSSLRRMPSLSSISPSVKQGAPTTPSRAPTDLFTFRMASNVGVKRDTILYCTLCQRRIGLWAFIPEPSTNTTEPRCESTDTDAESASICTPVPTNLSRKPNNQRHFDVLKEHRAYCPYVVRSTIVPTFPAPITLGTIGPASASSTSLQRSDSISPVNTQSTTLEGWRAVLTVVLRYGAVQRQRLGLDFVDRLTGNTTASDEPMEVDGVKAMIAGVKKRGGKDLLQYVKGLLG
ncbi:hypothetical protein C0992_001569 [Termitomyces sp. T32_za158]|nr:hypothetical protein C0992_001569 [Termitomyces sp. T32_za158]